MLSSTGGVTATHLYGRDRLASVEGSNRTWYLPDALGSVRVTLNSAGDVLATQRYDPYGTPQLGDVPRSFGFTGEPHDATMGLVNLRARWYATAEGRLLTRDPFAGFAERPYSQHPYAYALSSPTNYTDPSGECTTYGQGDDYCRPNPRDLTLYLYRAMIAHAQDTRVLKMRRQNDPFAFPNSCDPVFGFAVRSAQTIAAAVAFKPLVEDHGEWDIKHKIRERLGFGVTMCGTGGCRFNIEYSVAGNIHFGFIGIAAGFSAEFLNFGGSYAEAADPAHDPDRAREAGVPYTGRYSYYDDGGLYHSPQGFFWNFGDDPKDAYAVFFGSRLYTSMVL